MKECFLFYEKDFYDVTSNLFPWNLGFGLYFTYSLQRSLVYKIHIKSHHLFVTKSSEILVSLPLQIGILLKFSLWFEQGSLTSSSAIANQVK